MAATPKLQVTKLGLAVASTAAPQGPYIHITGFKIGSAWGYDPKDTDTGLNGATLYEGAILTYQNVGDGTINIVCRIPADAGPFLFGELGLYLDGGVLFAKLVFDTQQQKLSSLGTNVLSTYTFNCLIKLEQSVAVFKIDTEGAPPDVWTVDKWSDVYPPALSANPEIPLVLVRELDTNGNSSLLHKSNDSKWTVGTNYVQYKTATVQGGSTMSVLLPRSAFGVADSVITGKPNRYYVLEFSNGLFRSVASVGISGANYVFNLNGDPLAGAPTLNTVVRVYRSNIVSDILWQDIIGVPVGGYNQQGVVSVGNGIAMPQAGKIEVYGLLHDAPGTGRVLTSADNLNDKNFPSGIYCSAIESYGRALGYPGPANTFGGYDINADGIIEAVSVKAFPSFCIQRFTPMIFRGGDLNGVNQLPMYWRTYDTGNDYWTLWMPLLSRGRLIPGGQVSQNWVPIGTNQAMPADGTLIIQCYATNARAGVIMYLNGQQRAMQQTPVQNITLNSSHTIPVKKGDTWNYSGAVNSIGAQFFPYPEV